MTFFLAASIAFSAAILIISTYEIYPGKKKFSRMRQGLLMLAIGFSSISQFLYIFTGPPEGDQAVRTVRLLAQYLTAGAGILGVFYGLYLLFSISKQGTEKVNEE
ncbi:hypothetical protein [Variovorax sp. ZT4R33]|uniref:hypothetical protein n=1 Tax=Variovorax sp. ZT4R33 TaxID=3443743 RepID=UPI003F45C0DB